MSLTYRLTAAALAFLPFAVAAQQYQTDPGNADAPVSGAAYESALKNYRPAVDEQQSPDQTWRAANDEVGKLGGHAGHMEDGVTVPADHGKHHQPEEI